MNLCSAALYQTFSIYYARLLVSLRLVECKRHGVTVTVQPSSLERNAEGFIGVELGKGCYLAGCRWLVFFRNRGKRGPLCSVTWLERGSSGNPRT